MKIKKIILNSIPKIEFAHSYATDNYDISFPATKGFMEISYIETGSVYDSRFSKIIIPEGSLAVSFFEEQKRLRCDGRHRHYTVGFSLDYRDGEGGIVLPEFLTAAKDSEIVKLLKRTILANTLDKSNGALLGGMVLEIMGLISEEYTKNPEDSGYAARRYTEKAKRLILSRLEERLSLEQIADYLKISTGYLSRVFKDSTGMTVVEYTNISKLKRVEELVTTKKLTIREAGESVGLFDENYISRMYKKYFGHNITDMKRVTI